jgi:hypothetical protein
VKPHFPQRLTEGVLARHRSWLMMVGFASDLQQSKLKSVAVVRADVQYVPEAAAPTHHNFEQGSRVAGLRS